MNKKNKFGCWYERYLEKYVPSYGVFSLIFVFILNSFIYTGTQILMRNAHHYDFTCSIDRAIPFVPQWIYVYLICFGFWAINYILIVREGKEHWFRFVTAEMLSKITCGIFFILVPTTNIRPKLIGNSLSSWLTRFVYQADSATNLFPSIHCLVSWYCFIGIRRSKKIPIGYKIFSCFFAILVCISTQFTKQHYLVDLIAGIGLAEIFYYIGNHTKIYLKVQKVFDKVRINVMGG